ncbi:hypothetical protein AZF37_00010 [endosymbiont 'TC1' of Trimyema compressum]|nr:hypothetical protein AZF37_00010 [endosymbiont 'TC1' of Trimyema compressum]
METVNNFHKKFTGFPQSKVTILERIFRLIHVIHITDDDNDDKKEKKEKEKRTWENEVCH